MPGCTVPFCTNSSQKGYKVYHFPRDKERNKIWVKNCGRGQGWQSTDHTCICEVHFEDSQFESRRADGVRKLKPNAIPTLFKKINVKKYGRKPRQKNEPQDVKSTAASSSFSQVILDGSSVSSDLQEKDSPPVVNVSVSSTEVNDSKTSDGFSYFPQKTGIFIDHTYPKCFIKANNRDSGVNPSDSVVFTTETIDEQLESLESHCLLDTDVDHPPIIVNSAQSHTSTSILSLPQAQIKDVLVMELRECSLPISKTIEDESKQKCLNYTDRGVCLVCGQSEEVKNCISLLVGTGTSNVFFLQKLKEIVLLKNIPLSIDENGVLCSQCACLFNQADKLELELHEIRDTIAKKICQKNNIHPNVVLNSQSDLPDSEAQMMPVVEVNSSSCQTSKEFARDNVKNRDIQLTNLEDQVVFKDIQCHLCRFNTRNKSVMLYHLRQHLKTTCWCDFCKKLLPNDGEGTNDACLQNNSIDHCDQSF